MNYMKKSDIKALEGMFARLDAKQLVEVARGAIAAVVEKVCSGRGEHVRNEYMEIVIPVMKELMVFEIFALAEMAEAESEDEEI